MIAVDRPRAALAWAARAPLTVLRQLIFRFFVLLVSSDVTIVRRLRTPIWTLFYSFGNRRIPPELLTFINLGYADDPGEVDADARLSARLYDRVIADTNLEGRFVVEVGCGTGAGSAHLASAHRPAAVLGVDINSDLLARGAERHGQVERLRFLQGDAQSLPIATGTVDVLVNIESSHCYPSRLDFFAEVARVLRPGGALAFADLFIVDGGSRLPHSVDAMLAQAGLRVEGCADITANVLAARDAVWGSAALQERLRKLSRPMLLVVRGALFLPGSLAYDWLTSGRVQYWRWTARKPSPGSAPPPPTRPS